MNQRLSALLFLTAILTAFIVYEAIAYRAWGNAGTLTAVIRGFYADQPLIAPLVAASFGILFRHLFPPGTTPPQNGAGSGSP